MSVLNINLSRKDRRPIFTIYHGSRKYRVLFDTGSHVPVFCHGVHRFKNFAKWYGGCTIDKPAVLGGFGKTPVNVQTYVVPEFFLEDTNGNRINFKSLKFEVTSATDFRFDVVLPATMFNKFCYTLDYLQDIPKLTVRAPKDTYHTGYLHDSGSLYMFLTD